MTFLGGLCATHRHRLAFAAILLVAAAVRIGTADYGLWFDEIASTVFARQPLSHLWGAWMVRETNPPLFCTLLKGWMRVVGDGDVALRMLPIVIGLAGIATAWVLASRVGGALAGLLAAALLACSALHVDHSQEVRGYILAHTAALVATLAMIDYCRTRRRRSLVGYAVAALIALYSHTTMIVFVILANVAMVVVLRRDRRALAEWIAANGVVAIGWGWWLAITLAQLSDPERGAGWIIRPSLAQAWQMTQGTYLTGYALAPGGVAQVLPLAPVLAGIIAYLWHDHRPEIVVLAIPALGAPLLLFALSEATPIFLSRTLFWASGPWTVLLATAITGTRFRAGMAALAVALLASNTVLLVRWIPARSVEDWKTPLAEVARAGRAPILLVEGDAMALAVDRYRPAIAPALRLRVVARPSGHMDSWSDGLSPAPHVAATAAAQLLRDTGTVFTLTREDSDPGAYLQGAGVVRHLTDPSRDREPYLSRWDAP